MEFNLIFKIKKILVLMDGSKNAQHDLDYAITIAKKSQITITGLHAISFYSMGFQPFFTVNLRSPIEQVFEKEARQFFEQAEIKCGKNGIMFTGKIIHGSEGPSIVSFIQKHDFDLIVVGSRGRTSTKEIFLGSVSNYVLHRTKKPVMIVK